MALFNPDLTIYLTKYSCTRGITEMRVEDCGRTTPGMVRSGIGTYYFQRDYEMTMADAEIAATKMREKKIASLKKQIEKLEKRA